MKHIITISLLILSFGLQAQIICPIDYMVEPPSPTSCWVLSPVPVGAADLAPAVYDGCVDITNDPCTTPYNYIALDLPESCADVSCYDMSCLELYDNYMNGNNTCCLDTAMVIITVECCEGEYTFDDSGILLNPECDFISVELPAMYCDECCDQEVVAAVGVFINLMDVSDTQETFTCGNDFDIDIPFNACDYEVGEVVEIMVVVTNAIIEGECNGDALELNVINQFTITQALYDQCECLDCTNIFADIIGEDQICIGSTTDLTAVSNGTLPFTYAWNTLQTTQTITVTNGANYIVTVTDANGCTASHTHSLITTPLPDITCVPTDGTCNVESSITTTTLGVGGYSWIWSNGATTSSINAIPTGTYTVIVTDLNGCSSTCSASVVVDDDTPMCDLVAENITCTVPLGSVDSNISGGFGIYTYAWSNGATTPELTGVPAGTYTLTVTDSNGCTGSCTTEVLDESYDVEIEFGGNQDFCTGGFSVLFANVTVGQSPFDYEWSTGEITQMVIYNTGGTYSVTVTDALGCTGSNTIIVTEFPSPTCSATATDTTCGEANGTATVNATGGTPGYTYSWSSGQTTQSINNIPSGAYSVTVTDTNGCIAVCSATVAPSDGVNCFITNEQDPTCVGADGTISAQGTGLPGPWTYVWSSGQTSGTITGLTAGTYTVTVTNGDGCTDICDTVTLDPSECNIVSAEVVLINGCFAEITTTGNDCGSYSIEILVDGVIVCPAEPIGTDNFVGCDLDGFTGFVTFNMIHDTDPNCSLLDEVVGDVECGCNCPDFNISIDKSLFFNPSAPSIGITTLGGFRTFDCDNNNIGQFGSLGSNPSHIVTPLFFNNTGCTEATILSLYWTGATQLTEQEMIDEFNLELQNTCPDSELIDNGSSWVLEQDCNCVSKIDAFLYFRGGFGFDPLDPCDSNSFGVSIETNSISTDCCENECDCP